MSSILFRGFKAIAQNNHHLKRQSVLMSKNHNFNANANSKRNYSNLIKENSTVATPTITEERNRVNEVLNRMKSNSDANKTDIDFLQQEFAKLAKDNEESRKKNVVEIHNAFRKANPMEKQVVSKLIQEQQVTRVWQCKELIKAAVLVAFKGNKCSHKDVDVIGIKPNVVKNEGWHTLKDFVVELELENPNAVSLFQQSNLPFKHFIQDIFFVLEDISFICTSYLLYDGNPKQLLSNVATFLQEELKLKLKSSNPSAEVPDFGNWIESNVILKIDSSRY